MLYSIMFSTTFHVTVHISRKFGLLFGQCTLYSIPVMRRHCIILIVIVFLDDDLFFYCHIVVFCILESERDKAERREV